MRGTGKKKSGPSRKWLSQHKCHCECALHHCIIGKKCLAVKQPFDRTEGSLFSGATVEKWLTLLPYYAHIHTVVSLTSKCWEKCRNNKERRHQSVSDPPPVSVLVQAPLVRRGAVLSQPAAEFSRICSTLRYEPNQVTYRPLLSWLVFVNAVLANVLSCYSKRLSLFTCLCLLNRCIVNIY